MNGPKYQYQIDKYLDNNENGFYLRLIGNKSYITYLLNRYVVLHPERKNDISYILDNFDSIYYSKMTNEQLRIIIKMTMKEKDSNYLRHIYELLYSNEDEVEDIIKNNSITPVKFNGLLKKFKRFYPNQDEEIEYLNYIYDKYIKIKTIDNLDDLVNIKELGEFNDQELNLIDIYNSNYCIIEYCSKYDLSYDIALNIVNKYKNSSNEILKQVSNDILSRDSSIILDKLKNFANYIVLNDEFDILDYLDITKLSFKDFKKIVNPLISKEAFKIIAIRLKKIDFLDKSISKSFELESKTVIGGREITREEKEKVFEYIENNNYPMGVYQYVLRKYVTKGLDLNNVFVKK